MQQNAVLVGILHTESTTMSWSFGFRNLQVPGHVMPVTGMPFDMARNCVCQRALEGGYSHVFFLDSDVVPPHDAIFRLLARRKPVISGLYCRRSPPWSIPVAQKPLGQWLTKFTPGDMLEVDVAGAGCLLIERNVLERYKGKRAGYPWFDWRVNLQGHDPLPLSEDFTFMMELKAQTGISTWLDTSVVCKHLGLAESTYQSFKPCEVQVVT